ncbi:MAG: flavodoxin family protein [Oscillospiraceae bacterium]|jgi:multimeric flavodoxin WrbA|nr:flavodoxin family protein [Oscillospiraceae bacterium]
MKFLIISGNPKQDGLCKALEDAIARGARDGGAEVKTVTLERLSRCQVCGDGWGSCAREHTCVLGGDGFDALQETVRASDAFCFITPVYWGEVSEHMKGFLDRLRRCENIHNGNGALSGKSVLLACSPGGTGNGLLSALEQLDRFCRHTGAVIFDYLAQNRWSAPYKQAAAYEAAKALASGVEPWRPEA